QLLPEGALFLLALAVVLVGLVARGLLGRVHGFLLLGHRALGFGSHVSPIVLVCHQSESLAARSPRDVSRGRVAGAQRTFPSGTGNAPVTVTASGASWSMQGGEAGSALALLPDAGRLAAQVAQVVELRPADVAAADDLGRVDGGAVDRERPLNADAVAGLADGEGLAGAAALAPDHHALEDLDLGPVALGDAHVHLERVARTEVRDVGAH